MSAVRALRELLDIATNNAWIARLDQSIWGYDFNRHLVNSARLVGAVERESWNIDLEALAF